MTEEIRKVLVIYTGGTIGMLKNDKGVLAPQKDIESVVRGIKQSHDFKYWDKKLSQTSERKYLVLPECKDTDARVFYEIYEYEELKDSSNFTVDDWLKIVRDIKKFYNDYDGFVVLHGTDTTAYGASALSFMIESLGKTIVLTGAQIPIFQPRSDGVSNLISAVLIAAILVIPEVTVFFGDKLFRGNRVKKMSNTRIHAFDSPNYYPLLETRVNLEINSSAMQLPEGVTGELRIHDSLSKYVYVLKVAPTITPEIIRAICQPPMQGIVLETLGNGNIPVKRREIYDEIAGAVKRGVLVINVSQCVIGKVLARPMYETGRLLAECGVIPGYDMTAEAALAKLSYVLCKNDLNYKQKVEMMTRNLRGELTDPSS